MDKVDPLKIVKERSQRVEASVNQPTTFVEVTVGGIESPKIPALVDLRQRLCLPIRDHNKEAK